MAEKNDDDDFVYEYKITNKKSDADRDRYNHKRKERSRSHERRHIREECNRDYDYNNRRRGDRHEKSSYKRYHSRESDERDSDYDSRKYKNDRKYEKDYHSPSYRSNNNELIKYDDWDRSDSMSNKHFQTEVPNNTIMLRNLPSHLQESDIQQEVNKFGASYKDIRLMRNRETGISRGFAFVEYYMLSDAVKWMENTKGAIQIDGHRVLLNYSSPRPDQSYNDTKGEWICAQCGICNFKKRACCFKCNISKEESDRHFEVGKEGISEVSITPNKILLIRGLELCTTTESIIEAIRAFTYSPIVDIQIAHDPYTMLSQGFCFVEFMTTKDAIDLFASLTRSRILEKIPSQQPLEGSSFVNGYLHIHSKKAIVCYAKSASAALAIVNSNLATQRDRYQMAENQSLQNSKSYLAKTALEQAQAMKQGSTDSFSIPARPTHSLMSSSAEQSLKLAGLVTLPTPNGLGDEGLKYPTPDTTKYHYESTSGYYYDPATRLYYDATNKYYYNGDIKKFLYWDAGKSNYFLVPTTNVPSNQAAGNYDQKRSHSQFSCSTPMTATLNPPVPANVQAYNSQPNPNILSSQDSMKKDKEKAKDAKRIAREMEKWAKSMNQKKDGGGNMAQLPNDVSQMGQQYTPQEIGSNAADAGYAVLERAAQGGSMQAAFPPPASLSSLVAYNQDTDSDGEEDQSTAQPLISNDAPLIDEHILACLLCKRQFQSREILIKHIQLSSLHKENLAKYQSQLVAQDTNQSTTQSDPNHSTWAANKYRDRAKERREKFGDTGVPELSNQLTTMIKNQMMPKRIAPHTAKNMVANHASLPKIGEDNIGNRMLQSMGWKEGSGLGKAQQGIVNPIGPTGYGGDSKVGLGNAAAQSIAGSDAKFASLPGTYQDKIRLLLKERFEQS